jgi:lipopolysaccharide/colanic/teichoic acid biosynthesis glycosyltransferase
MPDHSSMKRLFDLIAATLALVVLAPLLIVIAILVRWRLGSPILYVDWRAGWRGEHFRLYKFRTMSNERDAKGDPLPDADRLTRFGRFLRTTSIDELPELWNVIRGDMSLVGPRPLLTDYLPLYDPTQARRHEVRPGLTGWAQVNGRNALTWEEKFELDVWYVDNRSIMLDLKILAMTVGKVLSGADVTAKGEATMPRFEGTRHEVKDR